MLAGRALNLATGVTGVAFQRLVAVATVEFEFRGRHKLHPYNVQIWLEKYMPDLFILSADEMRRPG
jgi:hypothetical protein